MQLRAGMTRQHTFSLLFAGSAAALLGCADVDVEGTQLTRGVDPMLPAVVEDLGHAPAEVEVAADVRHDRDVDATVQAVGYHPVRDEVVDGPRPRAFIAYDVAAQRE